MVVERDALPSRMTVITHSIVEMLLVNGAATDDSA
jgi:hypothetical protein